MNTWVERTCRSRCLWQSILSVAASSLALCSFAAIGSATWDDLAGPHAVDPGAVAGAKRISDLEHRFVRLELHDALSTGVAWVEVTKTNGSETGRKSTPFWATPVGAKFLLVRSPTKPDGAFDGKIDRIEPSVANKFDAADRAKLLPFALLDDDPRGAEWFGNLLVAGIAAWLVALAVRSIRRFIDPRRHPAVARLAADGDLRDVSKDVEREVGATDVPGLRGCLFTPNYFVDQRWPRFQVRRWASLAWAYAKVTQHRWGFVPTGGTHDLVLRFDDGTTVTIKHKSFERGGEDKVGQALEIVSRRAPWAIFGHDANREIVWRRDRAQILTAVSRRRAEVQQSSNGA